MTLTATQKRNCARLATYLEALPEGYEHFGMAGFYGDENEVTVADYNPCGTVACAIGHGPAAGIPVQAKEILASQDIDWWSYSNRFAPFSEPKWAFMFSGSWCGYDDTPQGAAQRIRWILAGNEPLCVGDLSYQRVPA